jgi:hypothetical protein
MQMTSQATYQLEQAIVDGSKLTALADSAFKIEEVLLHQNVNFLQAHIWKNLGLAYAHMVKNTEENFPAGHEPLHANIAGGHQNGE